jgi:hypothetical protein
MRILIFVLIAFLGNNAAHDAVTATFNIIERGEVLILEIDFDKHDYLTLNPSKDHQITTNAFNLYLNETSSWEIDGKKLTPQVLSIKVSGHHAKAICLLDKTVKKVKLVRIKNLFLLDIKSHSNIIKLDLNNTFKDFRLHKEKKELVVYYN